jgi:hypothetical protein
MISREREKAEAMRTATAELWREEKGTRRRMNIS